MPLTVKEGALLGSGMFFLSGAVLFYTRKQTLPFKICHLMAWPTLGSGVILALQPKHDDTLKMLEAMGSVDKQMLDESRYQTEMRMQAIKEAAGIKEK